MDVQDIRLRPTGDGIANPDYDPRIVDRIAGIDATALTIIAPDGRELLRIERDGTVTGEIEDASDAARIFVRELRRLLP